MSIILEASRYAEEKHRGQIRKYTGEPYIMHPIRVAGVISYLPCSTEVLVAAGFLHDVSEDCGVDIADIALHLRQYPECEQVAELVDELTNPSKKHPGLPRYKRKEMDLLHIGKASKEAQIIKMVDRIDNLLDYPTDVQEARDFVHDVYFSESVKLYYTIKGADEWLAKRFEETLDKVADAFSI